MSDTKRTRARRLVDAKLEADDLARRAKLAAEKHNDLEQAFWELMGDARESSVTIDVGPPHGRVSFVQQMTIRAHVRDKDAAIKSIAKAGLSAALIDPLTGIRKKPLNDYMKDWVKSGAHIPDGLDFSVTRYVTVTIKPD